MSRSRNKQIDGQLVVRRSFLIVIDILAFILSSYVSLWSRLEFSHSALLESGYWHNVWILFPLTVPATILIFWFMRLYNSLWEYAGEREFVSVIAASMIATMFQTVAQFLTGLTVPRSFALIQFFLLLFEVLFVRFSYRFLRFRKSLSDQKKSNKRRTMIVGAGLAGATTLRELQRSNFSQSRVVCLMDDDRQKIGKSMYGVPVSGPIADIPKAAQKYKIDEIIFAVPSVGAQKKAEILEICNQTGCRLKTLPGIYQLVNDEVDIKTIRDVQIEDLLFRESVNLNDGVVRGYYEGKTVLVTGGGGSIGSELCRQIATCHPRKLIVFDIYENNAYDIQQELIRTYGKKLDLAVEIGSVRDRDRLESIFEAYRPDVVFHASAHKHVPLMEQSPGEAIKNNVLGTYNTADMAEKYGVKKFILISTDKAVNPTNVMGASKRLCEMIVQSRVDSKTSFAAVRFGNVLGSNGSVIPLFKRQIAEGGPITITDKRIIRYFMTIPEASQLVMEAGAMAKKGELFVLDMGKPVRIYDLAVNLIKLSGLEPDVDIEIREIGLRPGEKLYEELLMKSETLDKTANARIFIERDKPLTREAVDLKLAILKDAVHTANNDNALQLIKEAIHKTVPTFHEPEELNRTAEAADEMQAAV